MGGTVGSLCTGIAGIEQALAQIDARMIWYAETAPDAVEVLGQRFPGVPNLGDVQDRATWRTAPVPDIVTAGFPCQPISSAGRQLHREDPRFLWPAVRDAVASMMPTTIFLENVQNIISVDHGSVLAEIEAGLRALGYAARWVVLGACAVGLSHHRHRWFCRADRVGPGDAPDALRIPAKCGAPHRRGADARLLPTPTTGMSPNGHGRRGGKLDNGRQSGASLEALAPTSVTAPDRWAMYVDAIARQVAATAVPPPEIVTANRRDGSPCLAPPFAEWMMSLPYGWVTSILDRDSAFRCIGNAVAPRQALAAWRMLAGPDE